MVTLHYHTFVFTGKMGNQESSLSQEDINAFQEITNFTESDLNRLHRRFRKIDVDGSGTLSTDEFLGIPQLAANPLLSRIIDLFDANHDKEIDFHEFVSALSLFSHGKDERKLQFAFQIYDMDGDGFIGNGELYTVLKMMVGDNLSAEQLQQVVDKTIIEADKDGDGMISFEEFQAMVSNRDDILSKMTFNFDS